MTGQTAVHAARVHDFDAPVTIDTVPLTPAGPGEVRIAVAAAGLNFPDLLVAHGTYQRRPELPVTLGMEAAGVVAGIGEDVTGFAIGDRVLALVSHGAFTESLVAATDRVYALPASMPFTEAAAFGLAGLTAHFALIRRGELRSTQTVLVTGVSGGVGAAAAWIAKSKGARVIGATRDANTASTVVAGAVDAFVSADPDRLRGEVRAVTHGRGVDLVVDVVGGEVLAQALRAVAWEGRAILVGFASGAQPSITPGHLLVKNISVAGLQITDYLERRPDLVRKAMSDLADDYTSGRLSVPVTATFPMAQAQAALHALRSGAIAGKAVLLADMSHGCRGPDAAAAERVTSNA